MSAKPKTVRVYQTKNGREPYTKWFDDIRDRKAQAVIVTRLYRTVAGNLGDVKSVGNGVHELRIHHGQGYRVYFGIDGDTLVILLTGSMKRNQAKQIKHAKDYWEDYKRRE